MLPSDCLEPVLALAERAGAAILKVYGQDFEVDIKQDDSPLTAGDRAAHEVIAEGLQRLTPEIPLLSEEGEPVPYEVRRRWSRYWLVDPLDGTREFIKRNGEFTVNIALIDDGEPVLGVIYAPVTETFWYAARGEGAHRRDHSGSRAIQTRALARPLVAMVSRSHRGPRVGALLARLPPHTTEAVGSSLKFCRVAEGGADLYARFGPTSEWDTAAAQCVVEEAGGRVCRLDLTPLRYNRKASLLNPDFLAFGDPDHDWSQYLHGLEGKGR